MATTDNEACINIELKIEKGEYILGDTVSGSLFIDLVVSSSCNSEVVERLITLLTGFSVTASLVSPEAHPITREWGSQKRTPCERLRVFSLLAFHPLGLWHARLVHPIRPSLACYLKLFCRWL
jgi:hypothetical protein